MKTVSFLTNLTMSVLGDLRGENGVTRMVSSTARKEKAMHSTIFDLIKGLSDIALYYYDKVFVF